MSDKVFKVAESDMTTTESAQSFFTVHAPVGTPREAPLQSIFWAHVARKLRPLAEITVITKDSSWYAKYLVLYVEGLEVKVKELAFHELEDVTELAEENATYAVGYGGAVHRYRVTRKADKEVIKHGFSSRSDAVIWMHRNLLNRAAA